MRWLLVIIFLLRWCDVAYREVIEPLDFTDGSWTIGEDIDLVEESVLSCNGWNIFEDYRSIFVYKEILVPGEVHQIISDGTITERLGWFGVYHKWVKFYCGNEDFSDYQEIGEYTISGGSKPFSFTESFTPTSGQTYLFIQPGGKVEFNRLKLFAPITETGIVDISLLNYTPTVARDGIMSSSVSDLKPTIAQNNIVGISVSDLKPTIVSRDLSSTGIDLYQSSIRMEE